MLLRRPEPDRMRWLPGARLNLSGRDPDAAAVLWAPEGAPQDVQTVTLGQLRGRARRVAAALRGAGYEPGAAAAADCRPCLVAVACRPALGAWTGQCWPHLYYVPS